MKKLLSIFKKPKKKVNTVPYKSGTVSTVVPREFLNNFKHWDDHKFNNIKIID